MRIERLLLALVPERWGDSIAGDLEEERARRGAKGERAGTFWGVAFCTTVVCRLLVEGVRVWLTTTRPSREVRMSNALFELRQAFRAVVRARGTTALVIVILGAAMGLSTAAFSVADSVLFKPLPYPAAEQLVELQFTAPRIPGISLSGVEFDAARDLPAVFDQVEAYNMSGSATRTDSDAPEILRVSFVSPGLLPMLGADVTGRHFTREDTSGTGSDAVILTHAYWVSRFGGDPTIIGRSFAVEGQPPLRVVGIADEHFVFPSTSLALLPQILRPLTDRFAYESGGRSVRAIARLRSGLTAAAADGAVPVDPRVREGRITATPLAERMAYRAREGLTLLFAGVMTLLVVGVLDVSSLLLAAATRREREVLTRRALGASTGRLVRQLLLESLFVAAAAGAIGLLLARGTFALLLQMVPPALQLLRPAGIDVRAAIFAAGVVALAAVLFGLAPMLHLTRLSSSSMRRAHGTTSGRRARRAAHVLVTGQVAAAAGLLVVGALLVSSFLRVRSTDVGFDAERLAFISVVPPSSMIADRGTFFDEARRRLSALPGVESVAIIDVPALRSTIRGTTLAPVGRPAPESDRSFSETNLVVTPGYFHTAGLALVDGRLFDDTDTPAAATIAVVNETLARTWFPGEPAVGKELAPVRGNESRRTIVGVVEDARHFALKEEPLAEIFLPYNPARPIYNGTFVLRASDPEAALPQAIAAIRTLAPRVPITDAETGTGALSRASQTERFYATLIATTAAMALTLAALGLYGVLSWSVGVRRRELGVRAALGADRRRLALGVAREAVPLVVAGAILGAIAGWWCARLASTLLYQVQPTTAEAWIAAGVLLIVTSALAIAIPSRRACTTSPADALRIEE